MTTTPSTSSLASGTLLDGKRHGPWTIRDDGGAVVREAHYKDGLLHGPFVAYADGNVVERGSHDRELRDGEWITYYPSGAIKSRETFVRGVSHGPSVTFFESGQVATRGHRKHGTRDGKHEKFFASGAPASEATFVAYRWGRDWYSRTEGREREWFEDGRISVDRTYVRGEIHGKAISNNRDSRDHERDMVFGVRHGLDKDWDGDALTEVRYVHGVPADKAKPKQLAALAAKLESKKKDRYEKSDLVRELTDGQPETGRLLWHLLREDLITGAALEELWEDMNEDAAATGADVLKLLSTVKKYSENSFMFLFWPYELDKLVCRIYARDPRPIDAALPKLPKHLRDAVRTVRARFGHDERAHFEVDMAAVLAKEHATRGIGSCSAGVHGESREVLWQRDGELQPVNLSATTDSDIANEAFYEFVELFTTRAAYTKALLDVCLKSDEELNPHRIADALRIATPAQFGTLLAHGVVKETALAFVLTKLRKDPAEALLRWAKQVDSDAVREILALVAAERSVQAAQPIPDRVDELLGSACLSSTNEPWRELAGAVHRRSRDNRYIVWTEQLPEQLLANLRFDDASTSMPAPFALYRDVLAALPRERALAIVTRMFAEPSYGTRNAIALAADLATPELVATIISYIEGAKPGPYTPNKEWALGLAALPSALTLSAIADASKRAPKTARDFWYLALLCSLAAAAGRGESWPAELDDQLHFGPFGKRDEGMPEAYANALRKILHALPLERAQPIFDRGFAQKPAIAVRTFVAIASHPVDSVLRPAFELLLAPELQLDDDAQSYIGWALAAMRETGARWARWVLANRATPSADLNAAFYLTFDEAFWNDDNARTSREDDDTEAEPEPSRDIARVGELTERIAALRGDYDLQPIYALVRGEPVAGSLNQIGGVPRGFTPETWPMTEDDEPMQFVCMIDLETVPALRDDHAPDRPRALALFISNAAHNSAYSPGTEQTKIIELTTARLAHEGTAPVEARPLELASFAVTAIDVPALVFLDLDDDDDDRDDDDDDDDESPIEQLKAIRQKVYALGGRAAGEPLWLQRGEHDGAFVLQLDESFVPELNLGDAGVMYVFRDTAFWQCH